jgi:hypothetical protein
VSPDGTLDNTLLTMPSIVSPKYFLGGFDTSTNNAFDIHWIKFFDPILTPAQMAVLSA